MDLKEIYLKAEDKWYDVLDKIDAHIPVYKLVDKMDAVVPSFALFIGIIALLVVLFVGLNLNFGSSVGLTVTIEDTEGNLLEGVSFDYSVDGSINSAITKQDGKAVLFIPTGSTIEITVPKATIEGIGFEKTTRTIFIENVDTSEKIVLREESPAFVERTILFQNAAGERITGKTIRVRLSCDNPFVTPSPLEVSDLDMDGSITVKEPRDCGVFQATVLEPEEFSQKSYILNQETQTLRLEGLPVAKGMVRIKIKDSGGNLVLSNNFNVKLLDSDGLKAAEKYSQNYGEVIFTNITSGIYTASVEDISGDYGIASSSTIAVNADETTSVDVTVNKSIKLTLDVSVVEKKTGNEITNVTLKIINSDGKTIAEKNTGVKNSTTFRITKYGDYQLFAEHADYLYEIVDLPSTGSEDIDVEMERATALNSGRVEVEVVDEDNSAVKNARVKLRFLDTGMLVPIAPKMTDRNGFAEFIGIKSGSYYAYVEKYPASGDNQSQGKEIDRRTITKFKVILIIGDSIIQVNAFDEDLQPVAEAEVEFFALSGESLGKIPLTEGTGQLNLKADKQIFAVVRHPDFMAVQAMPQQLWPNKTIQFDALMEPKLILGEPELEFTGIFDETGNQVQEMNAGKKYIAKFKLSVPESGNYGNGGIHFRVGDEQFLINDPLVIKEAIAGGIEAQIKGTSYSPPTGYSEDSKNITVGDGKWINIAWDELEPMNYYVGFEVRVKSQITPYTRLPMHYRAWAVNGSGQYIRTPEDSELGFSESVPGKQSLYAKTKDIAFLEGQEAECQEDFCYSGESIIDEDLGLYIYKPYEMRAGSPHNYTFSILNNSERQYSNSDLYITVDGMTIDAYEIQNASAQEISNSGISTKEIDAIDLGTFTKGKSVSGSVHFTPNTIGVGEIEIKIIADGRVVFQKSIFASILSENEMIIAVVPEHIPSYVATELEISIYDPIYEYDIDEALVRINVKNPDKTELFYSAVTNGFGKAIIELPALDPRTRIIIEAEKPDYFANPLELVVDSDVLRFEPPKVKASMETRGARELLFNENIENTTGLDVEIKNVSLTGRFRGLLDRRTMENYSRQFIGTKINANDFTILPFFKTKLSENIKSFALGNETVTGEYVITSFNRVTGIEWDTIIPLEVAIKMSDLPDNAPCIIISKQEWLGSTQGNRATIEFQVQNNCITGGRTSGLDSLQAMLSWNSDIMGQVELSLTDSGSGQTNTETLKPEMWTKIISNIRPESIFYGMLTFTPMAGFLGKDATFSVNIDGAIRTAAGEAFVGSAPEEIFSNIRIINLDQCIQYPGAENIIEMTGDTANFSVDASECGDIAIDIELCQNDLECRGGTTEGGITVTPKQFTLNANNPVQEVFVARQSIAGMYGIPVSARTPGRSYRKVALLDTLVVPTQDEIFTLDKYAFTLIGQGSQDNATLTNTLLSEQIQVDASVCDWGTDDGEGGISPMMAAGAGAAIAALMGAEPALKAAQTGMKAVGAKTGSAVGDAASKVGDAADAVEGAKDLTELAEAEALGAKAAVTAASKAIDAAAVSAKTITVKCDAGTFALLTAAATAGEAADTTANGTFWAKMALAVKNILSALANAVAGLFSTAQAQATAMPKSAATMSNDAYAASPEFDTAISELDSTISNAGENVSELAAKQGINKTVLANLKTSGAKLVASEATIKTSIALCTAHCGITPIPGPCCLQKPTAVATQGLITKAATATTNAIKAVTGSDAKDATAHIAGTAAGDAAGTAKDALSTAKNQVGKFGDVTKIASNAASFSYGKFFGIIGTYAAIGALAGYAIGTMMEEDPCEERFTATLMDYIINLVDDKLPIDVDHQAISGFWSVNDAKTFGTYDKQNVGVYFENAGGEESAAIYGVTTFRATRHVHSNPTIIEMGNSNFGPFNVPDQKTEVYSEKYHLKFVTVPDTAKVELLPQETYSCLQGSLFGETGAGALPDIKLNWSWSEPNGIQMDDCDYYNDDGIYCDATQFSIALTKKMQALREFLAVNQQIPCPINPAITDLEEIMKEFNIRSEELGIDNVILYYPGCWMPLSTTLLDGQPALLYFVAEAAENNNVNWTSDVQDLSDLENLIRFRARLIKDGYSSDFQKDFAEFYTTQSFYDSPNYFEEDPDGQWSSYFDSTDNLRFKQRFVENTSLPDAGVYDVLVNSGFTSGNWEFFDTDGNPDAKIVVEFLFLNEAYPNSVFYYLPFNGNIGVDTSNGRNGYGINYVNSAEPIAIASNPEMISTREIYGSNPVAEANIEVVSDFKTINSIASKRGFLLELEGTDLTTVKNISFYPNYATPVIMKMPYGKTNESFSAFYEIKESQTPVEAGTSLSFWTGAGQCLDFSGQPVYEAFRFKPDREATQNDPLSDWLFAYATDWDSAQFGGDVYLKAVFYSPISGNFKLASLQPSGLQFISPDSFESNAIDLQGIAGMVHNSGSAQDIVSEIQEIFNLVERQNVCVTDTGSKTSFWWNPKALNDAVGSKTSISDFESGLVEGSTCIGYGS